MQVFESGNSLVVRKDKLIVVLPMTLFMLLAGSAYIVWLLDYGWGFGLLLSSILALALALDLLTNVHFVHLAAPAAILVFFIFNVFYDLGFFAVLGWMLCIYSAGIVGALIGSAIKVAIKRLRG